MSAPAAAECDACGRRMAPSPDGLGPKCRARARPQGAHVTAKSIRLLRPVRGVRPFPNQIALFEETEHA